MIPQKLVEAAFRNLWVLVLPVVLVPVLVIFLTRKEPEYEATATVWVARPDGVQGGSLTKDASVFVTPAQAQVQVFYDLLSTRSFRLAIAVDADLIPPTAPEETMNVASTYIAQTLSVAALGTNLVGVTATTPHAEESYKIVSAAINQYQSRAQSETDRTNEAKLAYFHEQITTAEKELAVRRDALNAYIALNPTVVDPQVTSYDAEYQRLKASYDQQVVLVTNLRAQQTQVELDSVASSQGLQTVFSVQDAPQFPTSPVPTPITQKFGFPMAGLIFGGLISAGYLYLVYRLDQTIRSADDLEDVEVPLLGYVPEIRRGPGAGLWAFTPVGWMMLRGRRGYARKVAASLTSLPSQEARA